MNPTVTLAGASLLCFGGATIVTTLAAYTSSANPLALLVLAAALFVAAGLLGSLSITWYLGRRTASFVNSLVGKSRYELSEWLEEREEEHSIVRTVGLSTLIEPADQRSRKAREADSLTELQTRYVDGQLTEHEFEQEVTRKLELETENKL